MLLTEKEILRWLTGMNSANTDYNKAKYEILESDNKEYPYIVNVVGDFQIQLKNIPNHKIPVKFGTVTGNFSIQECGLKSLWGSPESVGGDFYCNDNQLESLEYGPKKVDGMYDCSGNKIKSLQYLPEELDSLDCSKNELKNLKYISRVISKKLSCVSNKITSLKHSPEFVQSLFLSNNRLKNLKYCPDNNLLKCHGNSIKTLLYLPKSKTSSIQFNNEYIGYEQALRFNEEFIKIEQIKKFSHDLNENLNQKTEIKKPLKI